jgi:hypothetical protein
MTDHTTTTAEQLAREVGAEFVQAKRYGRILIGKRTLAYVNPTYLDFKATDVEKVAKTLRSKMTFKGDRAHLPLTETKAATTLLGHVAKAD